ncbi:hypothetical protein [Nannocystis sp. SCPEA4]|uniref:hypothetical protein n=1 Tax=Nannocystis sp. SCPEA4 TaxID=2996787 RepID=UPI002270F48F|nr:hypothetical protein [Nannocystis sp. SCPEA4]MCY1059096.1 hypothetical protein [Nannocystis sp. SCPEA4]
MARARPALLVLLVGCGDATDPLASASTTSPSTGPSASTSSNGVTTDEPTSGTTAAATTSVSTSGPTTGGAPTSTTDPTSATTGPPGCVPLDCAAAGAVCGDLADGCGSTLNCGTCPGDQVCGNGVAPNQCGAAACKPAEAVTSDGGGRCADLAQAWTARGINAGYYPFRAVASVLQYSGDFSGDPNQVFAPGPTSKGVVLQAIPAGSYIGLSTTGPWYMPDGECQAGDTCGNPGIDACTDSAPPLRANIGGFYWGYAYSGASHMQGWIPYDPAAMVFAGFDATHPCARGPAGLDYEAGAACGQPTACAGGNLTCGEANPCSEGADDCGRVECGAMSGGPLTPTAHRKLVTYPGGTHPCGKDVPHPSITCFANGNDPDFFLVYPFGAYLYWAQNSTTKHWLHYGDRVQSYYHTRDAQGVMWDFVEVIASGAPVLTPASDGSGAGNGCSAQNPGACTPCQNGGTCGWIQEVFLKPE